VLEVHVTPAEIEDLASARARKSQYSDGGHYGRILDAFALEFCERLPQTSKLGLRQKALHLPLAVALDMPARICSVGSQSPALCEVKHLRE
jgi:hypothetical protein